MLSTLQPDPTPAELAHNNSQLQYLDRMSPFNNNKFSHQHHHQSWDESQMPLSNPESYKYSTYMGGQSNIGNATVTTLPSTTINQHRGEYQTSGAFYK